MSEEKSENVCKLKLKPDPEIGWKLDLDGSSTECLKSLEQVSKNLGPHGKEFLARRIESTNPEVKKTLRELGLAKTEE